MCFSKLEYKEASWHRETGVYMKLEVQLQGSNCSFHSEITNYFDAPKQNILLPLLSFTENSATEKVPLLKHSSHFVIIIQPKEISINGRYMSKKYISNIVTDRRAKQDMNSILHFTSLTQ